MRNHAAAAPIADSTTAHEKNQGFQMYEKEREYYESQQSSPPPGGAFSLQRAPPGYGAEAHGNSEAVRFPQNTSSEPMRSRY